MEVADNKSYICMQNDGTLSAKDPGEKTEFTCNGSFYPYLKEVESSTFAKEYVSCLELPCPRATLSTLALSSEGNGQEWRHLCFNPDTTIYCLGWLNISGPQFPYLENDANCPYRIELWGLNKLIFIKYLEQSLANTTCLKHIGHYLLTFNVSIGTKNWLVTSS